jgi:hypothetical protein
MYGDHKDLAERVLESLSRDPFPSHYEMRIGLNNVCPETHEYVLDECQMLPVTDIYVGAPPYYKYPLMRRMFHESDQSTGRKPIDTEFTMWFDDDSYITPEAPADFFDGCVEQMGYMDTTAMIGQVWHMRLRGSQRRYVEAQEWYTGRMLSPRSHRVRFVTGGWWCIRTEILRRHNWPPPDFEHNGGDVMMGEMLRQHNYRPRNFHAGVSINSDASGRNASAARRGTSQPPIGVNWKPTKRPPHLFDVLDGLKK